MHEMMKQCCGDDGKPDFAMMKKFMEHCGKDDSTHADLARMHQFCDRVGSPDMAEMKRMMESCGCCLTESAETE